MEIIALNDEKQKEKIQSIAKENKELSQGYTKIQNILAIQRYILDFFYIY